jgi:hypothetical protein
MLTGPGSLILMTLAGRPMVRSYWLGVQAEPARRRNSKLCYWRPCTDGRLRGARPVGAERPGLTEQQWSLLSRLPYTWQRAETEMARQGFACCSLHVRPASLAWLV